MEVVEGRGGVSRVGGAGAGAGEAIGWAGRAVCEPSGLCTGRAAGRLQLEAGSEGGGGSGYKEAE